MNTAEFLRASPKTIALTAQEQKQLQNQGLILTIGYGTAFVIVGILMVVTFPTIIENLRSVQLGSILAALLSLTLFFIFVYLFVKSIKDYTQDKVNGVKYVGIAKIVSKQYVYGSDGDINYYVCFEWCGAKNRQEITLDNSQMYEQLNKGDKAYLELAPKSNHLFMFLKK